MNRCTDHGQCTQGPDCPARATTPSRCEMLGVCNAGPGCTCPPATRTPVKATRPHWMDGGSLPPGEAGNWHPSTFASLPPEDTHPLGWLGTSLLLFWLGSMVGMVWLLMLGAGWAYSQWGELLWAFLARLS